MENKLIREAAHLEWAVKDRASRYEKNRSQHLRRTYGISLAEYDAMYDTQAGVCAICKLPCVTGRRLAVDHDHTTGEVRGLLCSKCNFGIGQLDTVYKLLNAVDYLEEKNNG